MGGGGSAPVRPGDTLRYNFDETRITMCTNCQWHLRNVTKATFVGEQTVANQCEATKRIVLYPGSEAVGYAHRDRCEDVNHGHCQLFVEKLKQRPLSTWTKEVRRRLGRFMPSFI